jgi:hypothetical protein
MSTLKFDLHKNDFLMDKVTKQLFFVVSIDLHNVVIREEKDGDDVPLKRMPKHMVNLSMIKVKPNVMKVLYGSKDGKLDSSDIPDLPTEQS